MPLLSLKSAEIDSKTSVMRRSSCEKEKPELLTAQFERYVHSRRSGSRHDMCVRGGLEVLEKPVNQRTTCIYQAVIHFIPRRDSEQETFGKLTLPVGCFDGEMGQKLLVLPFFSFIGGRQIFVSSAV